MEPPMTCWVRVNMASPPPPAASSMAMASLMDRSPRIRSVSPAAKSPATPASAPRRMKVFMRPPGTRAGGELGRPLVASVAGNADEVPGVVEELVGVAGPVAEDAVVERHEVDGEGGRGHDEPGPGGNRDPFRGFEGDRVGHGIH